MPNRTGDPPKQRARRSLLGTVAATLVAALIAAAVGFVFAYPLAGALACPRCFGFTPIAGHTYVETAMPPADRARTAAVLRQARAVVLTFYGSLDADPAVFVCATPECYQRFGGCNSRGMAMLDHALILSPDGVTPVIAAHELSHVELHQRAGAWRVWFGAIPRWFDEGLAINVSDDPRYLLPGTGAARCRARTRDPLPETRREWMAQADDGLYAVSACRVSEWLAEQDKSDSGGDTGGNLGRQRVLTLAARIADGADFAAASR